MKKSKSPRTKRPTESELRERLGDPDLYYSYRKARVDALRWRLEYKQRAWEISQLLAVRLRELLSVSLVKTIVKPGQEPQVVPRNSVTVSGALASLIGAYTALGRTVLAPLPSEKAVKALLADSAGSTLPADQQNGAERVSVDAGAPPQPGATECNTLQQNSVLSKTEAINPSSELADSGSEEEPSRKVA